MCRPPPTNESGITVLAKPIALSVNIFGTLLLLPFVLGLIPLLLVVVALSTVFDGVHCLLCAPEPVVDLGGDGADRARGGPVLVFPGTCNGVFFQFGMTQYLAERYDLRGARVVGVSSGALCAALLLALEHAADAAPPAARAAAARARACEVYALIEGEGRARGGAPRALGFAGRLHAPVEGLVRALVRRATTRRAAGASASGCAPRARRGVPSLRPVGGRASARAATSSKAALASTTLPAVTAVRAPLRGSARSAARGAPTASTRSRSGA